MLFSEHEYVETVKPNSVKGSDQVTPFKVPATSKMVLFNEKLYLKPNEIEQRTIVAAKDPKLDCVFRGKISRKNLLRLIEFWIAYSI